MTKKDWFLTMIMSILMFHAIKIDLFSTTPITGKWRENQFNISLVLNTDGTYALQHPGGTSQGRYQAAGQHLQLQDQHAPTAVSYIVLSLQNSQLILQDAQGIRMNFNRIVDPESRKNQPVKSKVKPMQELIRSGEHSLNTGHVETAINLVQFIIGQSVTPSERKEMNDRLIMEFKQEPAYILNQISSLDRSLKQLRTLSDPVHIGIARQELFSALYSATARMPEHEKPLLILVMNRYIRVISEDSQNKLLLTDRDVNGMISYLSFMSELSGHPISMNDALRRQLAADMVKQFPSMGLEQKKMLCSASLLWQLMDANWDRLSPAQKNQFRSQMTGQSHTAAQSRPVQPIPQKRSMSEQMADFQARQRCMQMMMDMNTQSHTTSLNIIENIGGTGNYWKVVDYQP